MTANLRAGDSNQPDRDARARTPPRWNQIRRGGTAVKGVGRAHPVSHQPGGGFTGGPGRRHLLPRHRPRSLRAAWNRIALGRSRWREREFLPLRSEPAVVDRLAAQRTTGSEPHRRLTQRTDLPAADRTAARVSTSVGGTATRSTEMPTGARSSVISSATAASSLSPSG